MLSVVRMRAKAVSWSVMLSIAGASSLLAGCLETYCQSGSKYGTQCYSRNEIEWQPVVLRTGTRDTGKTEDRFFEQVADDAGKYPEFGSGPRWGNIVDGAHKILVSNRVLACQLGRSVISN